MIVCDIYNISDLDYTCHGDCCKSNWDGFVLCEDCYKSNPDIVKGHDFK